MERRTVSRILSSRYGEARSFISTISRLIALADYLRLKDSYILTPDKLKNARKDMIIMHPLPRVNEISVAIDDDPRACYFKQVLNGKYMRMALIMKLLKEAGTI